MDECKGLVHPNVENIQELLKQRVWDTSKLALKADIDLRTIESVLRRERKQCAVMVKIADALVVPLGQVVKGMRENEAEWPSYSGLQIYKDWEPAWPFIEDARESVLILDSFFSNEHGRLGPALRKNADRRSKHLKVSIYMASPKRAFGAQRVREKDLPAKELLARKTTPRDEGRYRNTFRDLVSGIRNYGDCNADIFVFEYVCMPSLRIVLVDQTHFFWGWYPLEAQNPTHICLYVRGGSQNAADNELCEKLSKHIEKVMDRSAEVKKK